MSKKKDQSVSTTGSSDGEGNINIDDAIEFVYQNKITNLIDCLLNYSNLLKEVDQYKASIIGAIFEEGNKFAMAEIKSLNINEKLELTQDVNRSIIDAVSGSNIEIQEVQEVVGHVYENACDWSVL